MGSLGQGAGHFEVAVIFFYLAQVEVAESDGTQAVLIAGQGIHTGMRTPHQRKEKP